MYGFFMDGLQLPVVPSKLSTKIQNKNKTITLINEGEVNLLKTAGLTELSFDVLLPNSKYPFAIYPDGFQPATHFLDKFEKLKISKEPFQFIVTRSKPNGDLLFDTNLKVSLEEYEIKEDAENGFDIEVAISLKQFRDFGTKKLVVKAAPTGSQTTKKVTTTKVRSSSKTPAKTYTVKAGDTLWAICQRELGDGSKFNEIAKLNGINNPSVIKVGQVIKLG